MKAQKQQQISSRPQSTGLIRENEQMELIMDPYQESKNLFDMN